MFAINRSDPFTFDGTISGTGALQQNGTGTTIFTADNTYTGGTTIAVGTLQLGNGGTTGSIVGDVLNNATRDQPLQHLRLRRPDLRNRRVQAERQRHDDLTGNNTYTGGTTIAAGTLQLGDGGTTGSIVGDVLNNGTLAVNRSDTFTFEGVISGTGAFEQIGTGTTILTADNTYTGGTTIVAGTLQLGNGGTTGAILGDVLNSGTLAVNRSDTCSPSAA